MANCKKTICDTVFIAGSDSGEIGIVTVTLFSIATIAQGLKIGEIVTPALIPGDDVVNLNRPLFSFDSTSFAPPFGAAENVIAEAAWNIPG
ncbi:hypothetical protein A6A04_20185 [Paramagnetospirillum marisnigri]|uniref:Uncharacterized protein n=1 Tax=Paramagnetospirillum marisnigri TaxID=1285242 RepID=A0A178MJP5_9PROT|nr:hypothetical protein A6A04_20185 [Paramagnetospirillum marisnigri]